MPAEMHRHGEEAVTDARHPCFNASAGGLARIHLPVAPECNISCAYCDRKTDCVNESRPGLCSRVLDPEEAADRVDEAVRRMPALSVAGIAGPGDPLATPELTLRTFALVRRRHPDLLLCLSTNGLALAEHAAELEALGVGHVTITVNAVSPDVAARIYHRVRVNGASLHGREAGEALLDRQARALAALERHGVAVKVNTVVIPGVNDNHVEEIARYAAGFRVGLMNCIGLIPVPGTAMGRIPAPGPDLMEELRRRAGAHMPQMRHCTRCRADACGTLTEEKTVGHRTIPRAARHPWAQ